MKIWNRLDNFLAWISGSADADKTMDPRNPREYWLKQIAENGGSGGGYTVTEETVTIIPEQSVETAKAHTDDPYAYGQFVLSESVNPDDLPQTLFVTFGGTEYECEKVSMAGGVLYGASFGGEGPDFSEYPFAIAHSGEGDTIFTATAQTVTVKAESVSKTVTPSEDFKAAVRAALEEINA